MVMEEEMKQMARVRGAHYSDIFLLLVLIINLKLEKIGERQELITRSVQLPHIRVTAFLRTNLFLD